MKVRRKIGINELDFSKGRDLIPVVVQDYESLRILTLAYVNREALEKTLKTGFAYFFRRSHGSVMMKGSTSGNKQKVKEILVDCDHDALVYMVKTSGPACHLGEDTCFHNELNRSKNICCS